MPGRASRRCPRAGARRLLARVRHRRRTAGTLRTRRRSRATRAGLGGACISRHFEEGGRAFVPFRFALCEPVRLQSVSNAADFGGPRNRLSLRLAGAWRLVRPR
jgi:hypothetical protein